MTRTAGPRPAFSLVLPAVLALLLSVVLIAPATAREAEQSYGRTFGEAVSTFTLDNGLEVVVIEDHRSPVATHMIWYRVGSADESPGKTGIAHFLEHLMFKGTEAHPEGEFSRVVAEIGGQENAFTSSDYTAYYQRVAREHLGLMMKFEADRMTGLVLDEAAVASEREVVEEERASRVDNDPASQLSEMLDATFFMVHPYGQPIIGWAHDIEELNREDALAFYERFYTPNNAILVVAGDVTPEEVRELAEATYGKVERRAEPGPRIRPQEPEPLAARTATLVSPRVDQESVRRQWLVPSYATAEGSEAEAFDVLAEILGGGSTSRLYRQLVVEEGIASSAAGWYLGSALDDTRFSVYAAPRPGHTLEEVAEGFDRVIADLIENGISDDDLERVKNSLVASAVYARDSQTSLARIYGVALTTGSTVADVDAWVDEIRAVTEEEVIAVARKYLTAERSATGFLRAAPDETAAATDPS